MIFDLNNLQDYTVKILDPNNESIIGTGFFFHPDGYILTCYHVIDSILVKQETSTSSDLFQVSLSNRPGTIDATLIHNFSLKEADIAVLKIKKNANGSESIHYLPLEIHYERGTAPYEKITSFGHPIGPFFEEGIQTSGEIFGTTKYDSRSVFQIGGFSQKETSPGYSGSPVICVRTKKVIGLIYATYQEKEYVSFFISISDLIKHWEKNWAEMENFHDVYRKIQEKISSESNRLLQEKLQKSPFIPLGLLRGDIPKKKKTDRNEDFFRRNDTGKLFHQREWHNFSNKDLLPPTGSYLLSSDVGSGKTTFLYWLTCEINKNPDNFAIYVLCSSFSDWKPESWDDLKEKISNSFKPLFQNFLTETIFINNEDIKDCLDFYFYKNKIVFLYDALDQASEKSMNRLSSVKTMLKISGQNHTLISSRPLALIDFDKDLTVTFLRLKQFSKDDERIYFGKYFGAIGSIRALAPDMKKVPMLAFMIKTLAINENIAEIKNRADLYERFIDYIFTQQNLPITPDGQRLSAKEELEILSFKALNDDKPSIQIIPLSAKYINRESISLIQKYGLVNFILEENKEFLLFSHTSYQEFLAAKFIDKSEQSNEYIRKITSDKEIDKWREIIRFLAGMRGNEIISQILVSYKPQSDREGRLLYFRNETILIIDDIKSLIRMQHKPWSSNQKIFFIAELLPEIKKVDMNLYEQIYTDLHTIKNSKCDGKYHDHRAFEISLIYLSRVQGLSENLIKKNVIDIINCLTIEDKDTNRNIEFYDDVPDLIYDNDPDHLVKLASILSIQRESTRLLGLEAFKEELLKNN